MKRHLCLLILLVALVPFTGVAFSSLRNPPSIDREACLQAPLTYISLEAIPHPEGTLLQWRLEKELPVVYYFVERSTNGGRFELVGGVKAHEALPRTLYRIQDRLKAEGPVRYFEYRVEARLADGSRYYTHSFRVYPPDAERVRIHSALSQPRGGAWIYVADDMQSPRVQLELFTLQGHKVHQVQLENLRANTPKWLSLPPQPQGVYLFRLTDGVNQWYGRTKLD